MNGTNYCNDLEIKPIDIPTPFAEMYKLQRRLQLRLNAEAYNDLLLHNRAKNSIYWFYCIAAECKELLMWFDPAVHEGLTHDQILAEVRMEAIDILHFVMNIGLELGIADELIEAYAQDQKLEVCVPMRDNCERGCTVLTSTCIDLIDALPWKTWKTYDLLHVEDKREDMIAPFLRFYRMSLQLCAHTGLDKADIVNWYFAKNAENHNRQDNGY